MNSVAAPTIAAEPATAAPSLVDRVMRAMNAEIRDHGLKPGDSLPGEAAMALALGVSRGVVREAFRSLAALHVIDIANGRRPRVSAVDDSVLALMIEHAVETNQVTIQQTLDVRRAVELRTAALAALRRSDAEAAEILSLSRRMRKSPGGSAEMTRHDIAFHARIAAATRNPMFSLLVSAFKVVMERTCPIGWFARATEEERLEVCDLHDAIAEAIRDRLPLSAERAMAAHFDLSIKALVTAGIT